MNPMLSLLAISLLPVITARGQTSSSPDFSSYSATSAFVSPPTASTDSGNKTTVLGILVGLCFAIVLLGVFAAVLAYVFFCTDRNRRGGDQQATTLPDQTTDHNSFDCLEQPGTEARHRRPKTTNKSSRTNDELAAAPPPRTSSAAVAPSELACPSEPAQREGDECHDDNIAATGGDGVSTIGPRAIKELKKRRRSEEEDGGSDCTTPPDNEEEHRRRRSSASTTNGCSSSSIDCAGREGAQGDDDFIYNHIDLIDEDGVGTVGPRGLKLLGRNNPHRFQQQQQQQPPEGHQKTDGRKKTEETSTAYSPPTPARNIYLPPSEDGGEYQGSSTLGPRAINHMKAQRQLKHL